MYQQFALKEFEGYVTSRAKTKKVSWIIILVFIERAES